MLNTILVNLDKTLEKTSFRAIYQNENRADDIQFLIDKELLGEDISNYKVILQAIIPVEDKEHNSPSTGKMRYMEIEEEEYCGKYRSFLPITTALTEGAGNVFLWFLFFDMKDTKKIRLIKTNYISIHIQKVSKSSSVELEDKEFDNVISNIQVDIDDIRKNKIDKQFDYDPNNNTILFYSNGQPIGDAIKLDDEITWTNWD